MDFRDIKKGEMVFVRPTYRKVIRVGSTWFRVEGLDMSFSRECGRELGNPFNPRWAESASPEASIQRTYRDAMEFIGNAVRVMQYDPTKNNPDGPSLANVLDAAVMLGWVPKF